jgi:hypothetical protein
MSYASAVWVRTVRVAVAAIAVGAIVLVGSARLAVGPKRPGRLRSGALVGNLWTDPKGRLWLFFDQQLGDPQGRITDWWMRCDDPDAAAPAWTEPVLFAEGCTLNKPTVLASGDWLLPVSDWHAQTARVYASTDEGASWSERGSVRFPDWEFDERAAVSYPDGCEGPDGLIHILYDWNRHTDAEILLATFREADVLAGKAVSPNTTLRRLVNKATGPKP